MLASGTHLDFDGLRRQSAGLTQDHYPGQPAPIHLQPPIAPSFKFGSLNLSEDYALGSASDPHVACIGTPAAELGPFEYPLGEGLSASGRNSPARPGINPLGDGLTSNGLSSLQLGDGEASGARSVTTGQIPVLPAARRPSVIHSATVTSLPQQGPADLEGDRRDSSSAAGLADLARRRPSVLLSRLIPPPSAPTPPSLLGARRGSLPAASLFPRGGLPSRPPSNQDGAPLTRPALAQGWTPTSSSAAVPGSAISAAYLYNRRSSLVTPAYLGTSSIASPVRPIGSLPSSIVDESSSPAPSSRGSFSSHSTITAQDSPRATPLGSGSRRQSLPTVDIPPPTTALESYCLSKASAEAASDQPVDSSDSRPLSLVNLLSHGYKGDMPVNSALSTASGSSSGQDIDEPELSQVARVAAAVRERRRSSRNSMLSKGSLVSIPADEAVLHFLGPGSHRGSTDSAASRSQASQASISSGESARSAAQPAVEADLNPSFASFSFPARSPIRRTPPTRPGLETIQSNEKDQAD